MSNAYVPMISSGIAGPLGIVHLPRLWQKVSLETAGKLASGYPAIGKGFDAMTLAALGLEEQAVKGGGDCEPAPALATDKHRFSRIRENNPKTRKSEIFRIRVYLCRSVARMYAFP